MSPDRVTVSNAWLLLAFVGACVAPATEDAGKFVQGAERGPLAIPRSPHAQFRPVTMDEAAWT